MAKRVTTTTITTNNVIEAKKRITAATRELKKAEKWPLAGHVYLPNYTRYLREAIKRLEWEIEEIQPEIEKANEARNQR